MNNTNDTDKKGISNAAFFVISATMLQSMLYMVQSAFFESEVNFNTLPIKLLGPVLIFLMAFNFLAKRDAGKPFNLYDYTLNEKHALVFMPLLVGLIPIAFTNYLNLIELGNGLRGDLIPFGLSAIVAMISVFITYMLYVKIYDQIEKLNFLNLIIEDSGYVVKESLDDIIKDSYGIKERINLLKKCSSITVLCFFGLMIVHVLSGYRVVSDAGVLNSANLSDIKYGVYSVMSIMESIGLFLIISACLFGTKIKSLKYNHK